jgi:hypothetical protein
MNVPVELKWKGAPAPRAKPINPQKWNEHKDEIVRLHGSVTVDQLMKEMEEKHSFKPS